MGFTNELEKLRKLTIIACLHGIETPSPLKPFEITKGSQQNKAWVETNSKVLVTRSFREVLFCCCDETLPCLSFLQTAMLQPQIVNSRITANGISTAFLAGNQEHQAGERQG